jgi:uncharacterized protein YukE
MIPHPPSQPCGNFGEVARQCSELVIRGRSMKTKMHLLATLGLLPLLVLLSLGSASAQTDIAKAIQERLAAQIAKLQNSCADEINKYCSTVTPGEDKISAKCAYEMEETAARFQTSADNLRDAINACKAEITGVCGKTLPGEGRVAACLLANKSTASKNCVEALQKIEAMSAQ